MPGYSASEDRIDELTKFFIKKDSRNWIRFIMLIATLSLLAAAIALVLFAVRMLGLGFRTEAFYAIQKLYWRTTLGHLLTSFFLVGAGGCAISMAYLALSHFMVFIGFKVLCDPYDVISLLEHRSINIDRNEQNSWRIVSGIVIVSTVILALLVWKNDSVSIIIMQFKLVTLIGSLLIVGYGYYDLICDARYSGLPTKRILDIRWGRASSVESAIHAAFFIVLFSIVLPSTIQWLGNRETKQFLLLKDKIVRFDCSGPSSKDCEAIRSEAIKKIEDSISSFGKFLGTGGRHGESAITATVTATILNLRSQPSEDAPVVGQLGKGSTVDIVARDTGWVQVNSRNGNGWVSSQYVQTNGTQPSDATRSPSLANAAGQIGFIYGFALSVLYIGLPMLYRIVPISLLAGLITHIVSTIAGNVAAWLLAEHAGISNPHHWVVILTLSIVSMAVGSILLPGKKS